MTFSELKDRLNGMPLQEHRVSNQRYLEVVAAGESLVSVRKLLGDFFGEPVKPEGKNPSKEDKDLADRYGGVRKDQTLYFLKNGEGCVAAMLWPWSDGETVTVKVFQN